MHGGDGLICGLSHICFCSAGICTCNSPAAEGWNSAMYAWMPLPFMHSKSVVDHFSQAAETNGRGESKVVHPMSPLRDNDGLMGINRMINPFVLVPSFVGISLSS